MKIKVSQKHGPAVVGLFGIRTHRILTKTTSTAQPNFVKRQPSITSGCWLYPHKCSVCEQPPDSSADRRWRLYAHRFYRAPRNVEEQVASRDAIAEWARTTYGWMGRSPDYKASFLTTLGANNDFYKPFHESAKRWYYKAQERNYVLNHAIIHPPVDRDKAPDEVWDVYVHVDEETDGGVIVSGAKVVATGSALTHYSFVAHHGAVPLQTKKFAIVFAIPTSAPGLKFICRGS